MVSGINAGYYNPYQTGYMLDNTQMTPVSYGTPTFTAGVSKDVRFNAPPQEKKDATADGKDDGSIGFVGATKNLLKGAWNFLTSPFKNEKGEWSLWSTVKSAAIAAAFVAGNIVTGGALTPILLAGGAVAGVWGAGKAAYNIATAETDAQAEAAWQSMGSSAATIAATAVGAKGYAKASAKADIASAQAELRQALANDDVAARLAAGSKLSAAQARLEGYNGLSGYKNAIGRTFVDSKANITAGAKIGWNYGATKFGQVTQAYKDGVLKDKLVAKYDSAVHDAQVYGRYAKIKAKSAYRDVKAMTGAERKEAAIQFFKDKLGSNRAEVWANTKAAATNPENIGIHTYLTKQSFAPDFYDSLSPQEKAYFDSLPKAQREQIEDQYYSMV